MKKKNIFIWLAILILGIVFIFSSYHWFQKKQIRVLNGTARPEFPYNDYSDAELQKMFPHDVENNAPVVQTPEETHAKFIAAVKAGNFDEAVNCCFREGDRVKMKDFLNGLKKKGQINLMLSDIKDIHKDNENSWEATYVYSGTSNGEKVGSFMTFIKTTSGYWYIESL